MKFDLDFDGPRLLPGYTEAIRQRQRARFFAEIFTPPKDDPEAAGALGGWNALPTWETLPTWDDAVAAWVQPDNLPTKRR
jgi:hypothetical protein